MAPTHAPTMEYMHTDVPPGMTLAEWRHPLPRRESSYMRAIRTLLHTNPTMTPRTAARVVEEMN